MLELRLAYLNSSTMMNNGSSRVVILEGSSTGNLREGIGVLEEAPSSGGTRLTVPRQVGIETKERHVSLDDGGDWSRIDMVGGGGRKQRTEVRSGGLRHVPRVLRVESRDRTDGIYYGVH
jgi:hypothetical protein